MAGRFVLWIITLSGGNFWLCFYVHTHMQAAWLGQWPLLLNRSSHLCGNPAQCIVLHLLYDMYHHPSGSSHQIVLCHLTQISLNISQPLLMPVGVVSTWLRFLWSKESGLRCIVRYIHICLCIIWWVRRQCGCMDTAQVCSLQVRSQVYGIIIYIWRNWGVYPMEMYMNTCTKARTLWHFHVQRDTASRRWQKQVEPGLI